MTNCLLPAYSAETELILDFGAKPNVDGQIDRAEDEWSDAVKSQFFIYQNLSDPENGLEIDLWIIQHELFLYIAISFELVEHECCEFVGVLTAESESLDPLAYEDAKIIQFLNISEGNFEYRDYYINNSRFFPDLEIHGAGAAQLDIDREKVVYEFKLPVESSEGGGQDTRIEAGIYSPFMIIFGEAQNYDEDIVLMNLVSLFVQFYAYNPIISAEEILFITLAVVIFSIIGLFYGYYMFQIIKLKDKIKKIRS
ncbi:MAG: hypothetical protein EU550_04125 [Promethearchaeota archaeon]|nr:MAG: hypothetical protein EU550_04125 [Candidatus Lokiarchaeota archaeon]